MLLMGRKRKLISKLKVASQMLIGAGRRRTHQSGPLGELFDHGVDAVNTSLEVLIFAASQNLGMGWKTVMTLFGGKYLLLAHSLATDTMCLSSLDLLRANLGRIPYQDAHSRPSFRTRGRNRNLDSGLRIHSH